jgi:UDP-galactopyranose mutase
MKTALIIGGGFAGCAAAHQLQLQGGWQVTVVEAAPHLGAGVRTQWMGGHPYTFGPRHFLTQREDLFAFLDKYLPLRLCPEHQFLAYVERDQAFYNYPIHEDDIPGMPDYHQIMEELEQLPHGAPPRDFERFWIDSIGPTLYDKFINAYSKKMWQVQSNTEIDTFNWSPKGVTIKRGPRAAWDTAISAYPMNPSGYDDYFALATADTDVLLNTRVSRYDMAVREVTFPDGTRNRYDTIISTIAPDTIYGYCYGTLPFIGRDIQVVVLPVEFALPPDVYFCYYTGAEKYTRVTEYKKFTRHRDPSSTLITIETPSKNGRLYPLPIKRYKNLAQRYLDAMPERVFSIGRAGSYDYGVDIDDCIGQAMGVAERLK